MNCNYCGARDLKTWVEFKFNKVAIDTIDQFKGILCSNCAKLLGIDYFERVKFSRVEEVK